ncbi:hypothetical protein HNP46_000103 [Pseudomonas nitritireducens]|uniref:HD domain-containing protein n=1 Tax=Pseudomonas nitroreducens TaxID=46680 RepID=A0A7W7NZJ8_PSENT|nr:YfbR-like 5'-deoxynucleotidase [Pseudomonas nitritireducens]MBB4861292.1 hypothetical protein [Pseudomonas nitritireducens]
MVLQVSDFSLANVAHTADTKRWHKARSHRLQMLAEHAYRVTIFCQYLAEIIDPMMDAETELKLLHKALWHDTAETITGDLPTPIKRLLAAFFPKDQNPIDDLELSVCAPYRRAHEAAEGSYLEVILKLADIMDAHHFIRYEGRGRSAKDIAKERKNAFGQYVDKGKALWPQYNWDGAHEIHRRLFTDELVELDFNEMAIGNSTDHRLFVPIQQKKNPTCGEGSWFSTWTRHSFIARSIRSLMGR